MKTWLLMCAVSVAVMGCAEGSGEQAQGQKASGSIAAQSPTSTPAPVVPAAYWIEGFGQGNLEYFIDHQGVRLYISCPTQDGSAGASSGVSLSRLSDDSKVQAFSIAVNGSTYDAPFRADNLHDENAFLALLDDLREDDAVVSFADTKVIFPKSNSSEVLPFFVFGNGDFPCNLM